MLPSMRKLGSIQLIGVVCVLEPEEVALWCRDHVMLLFVSDAPYMGWQSIWRGKNHHRCAEIVLCYLLDLQHFVGLAAYIYIRVVIYSIYFLHI